MGQLIQFVPRHSRTRKPMRLPPLLDWGRDAGSIAEVEATRRSEARENACMLFEIAKCGAPRDPDAA